MSSHLNSCPQFLESLLGDLDVPLGHVSGLLGIERVSDASEDENIKLDPLFSILLLLLLSFL